MTPGLVARLRARLGGTVAGRLRHRALLAYYRVRRRAPVDPRLALFSVYWDRGYSCNPKAIYEKARELVPGFRGVWVVDRNRAGDMPAGIEYVHPRTRAYYDVLARAGAFVNNVNFSDELVKRPGTRHVMTHHGTPLKYMGMDLQGRTNKHVQDFAGLNRRTQRWDYSVSSNGHSTQMWERAYPGAYETLEVGYPRNDALADATAEQAGRIRASLGVSPRQATVLYAPTHRDDDVYVPLLDVARLAEQLGPDWVVLLRRHHTYPAEEGLGALQAAGRVLDVSAHPSTEDLCIAADMLITDYSSIMFDYAVLDRPIIIHAPDWEAYRETRGVYFDLMADPPGVVTRTDDDVVEALRSGAAAGEEATWLRAAFRERFCSLDDGGASERVVRRVWLSPR